VEAKPTRAAQINASPIFCFFIFSAATPGIISNFSVSDVPLGPPELIASWSKLVCFSHDTIPRFLVQGICLQVIEFSSRREWPKQVRKRPIHLPCVAIRQLPELFKDAREMPDNLRRHIRYPEDIFTVQAEMYGTYHMTNPTTFYNREDRREVPHELYRGSEIAMLPYYVTTQLPGSERPEFLLMLPLAVAGKNQMAGWLAGLSDGDNYGKMVAFRFPKGTFIDGPAQVELRISSDSRFSGDLTLWDQHGSQVISHCAANRRQPADRNRARLHRGRADQDPDTRPRGIGAAFAR
jgi:hypothetical protein